MWGDEACMHLKTGIDEIIDFSAEFYPPYP